MSLTAPTKRRRPRGKPKPKPKPEPKVDAQTPTAFERHLLNRMGCGFTPTTWAEMRAAGGAYAWFDQQLTPANVPEDARALEVETWFPDLEQTPATKRAPGNKGSGPYADDLEALALMRRIYSRRTVFETMVGFWADHLHVHSPYGLHSTYRADYEDTLRRHALGRFEDLLFEATTHPAMVLYLDNWRSTARALNENHGREVLELHTVGRDAGYTESMVKDSAKILSGYTVEIYGSWLPKYSPERHATGPVRVLDFTHLNSDPDGREVTAAYLRYLARHPATARNIARKLAVKFVSDQPSDQLIDSLARAYLANDTAIAPVLQALVRHPEFAASMGRKVRTYHEDVVSTLRILDVAITQPVSKFALNVMLWDFGSGNRLYHWPRPEGFPATNAESASVSRMLASFRMHWVHTSAQFVSVGGVTYRPLSHWLPQPAVNFRDLVEHLARSLHGKQATDSLLQAASEATGLPSSAEVTESTLAGAVGIRLLAVFLDHPDHMMR